jgi:O-antigen ligase
LCLYLTISRGGALALAAGVLAFLVLVPHRLHAMGTVLAAAAGSAILISAASQRDALQDGLPTATAIGQGTELRWLAVIACGGMALLQVAIALAARHVQRPAILPEGRRATAVGMLGALLLAALIAAGAGAPRAVDDLWQEFRAPAGTVVAGSQDNLFSRLQAVNGNSRFQYWEAARKANASDPLIGIGPGTFEFWWARHGDSPAFVRDAHSLYFETLAETGIVGLLLLGGLLLWLLGAAVVRLLRAPASLRLWIAGAAAGLVAFMTAAAFEWVWEMAAVAVVAVALGAVIVSGRDDPQPESADVDAGAQTPGRLAPRALLVVLSLGALVAVIVPLAGAVATRDSQRAAAQGRPVAALEESAAAHRIQPYAATPDLQRALVLEEAGVLDRAASAARAATRHEPTNWRTWLVLARIDARRGSTAPALVALRKARALNPRSPLLAKR